MSFDYNNTSGEELQDFFKEKLQNLAKRVEYKNTMRNQLKNVLSENQYQLFCDCGNYLAVNENNEVVQGNFCKNRLCPVCNRKYASQKWHKIKNIADNIKASYSPVFALLTLTVKNVPAETLSAEIDRLMKSIDRMHKSTLWKENVFGFFRSLEITYNKKAETYHPHYHYVLCLPSDYAENMTSTYEWRKLWERSARLDYVSQIDLQIIKSDTDLSGGIAEVAKYAVKISTVIDHGDNALKPLVKAIKGRRLISYGGIIKECAKSYEKQNKKELEKRDHIPVSAYEYIDGHYIKKY